MFSAWIHTHDFQPRSEQSVWASLETKWVSKAHERSERPSGQFKTLLSMTRNALSLSRAAFKASELQCSIHMTIYHLSLPSRVLLNPDLLPFLQKKVSLNHINGYYRHKYTYKWICERWSVWSMLFEKLLQAIFRTLIIKRDLKCRPKLDFDSILKGYGTMDSQKCWPRKIC